MSYSVKRGESRFATDDANGALIVSPVQELLGGPTPVTVTATAGGGKTLATLLGAALSDSLKRLVLIPGATGIYWASGNASNAAVNQVEALPFVNSSGAGSFTLTIEGQTTGPITFNSTVATLVTSLQSALDSKFGANAIVASGASLAAVILTFSGTGFAGRPLVGHVTSTITLTSGTFTINGSSTAGTSTTTTIGIVASAAFGTAIVDIPISKASADLLKFYAANIALTVLQFG